MGEWICDDRESPEEWGARMRKYRAMTMEEIDKIFPPKKEVEKKKAV